MIAALDMTIATGRAYLPTLLAPKECFKLPIAVGYTCVAVGKVRAGRNTPPATDGVGAVETT